MAHTLRWNTVTQTVRNEIGRLGPLRALGLNQRFEPSALDWLDRPEISGGGILLHTGVHSFDLVRFLTGAEVARVWCRTSRVVTTRTEDNFVATFDLAGSDTLVTVSGCRATAGRSGLIDAACRDAQVVADHQQHFAHRIGASSGRRSTCRRPRRRCGRPSVVRRAAPSGHLPPTTLTDGVCSVMIAEACMRSRGRGPLGRRPGRRPEATGLPVDRSEVRR
jgi:predicted dehydrogenase